MSAATSPGGIDPNTGNPQRNVPPAILRKEVETCGLCHARRGAFSEDWVPGQWLSDTHVVSALSRGLYFADGQMQDEVYNYGSFKQSKMFAAGVTCSDCHDPHDGKLKMSGDGVCLQCHAPEKYAAAAHGHHEAVNPSVGCASCHMPTRTYMVVDPRHDHSLRVPRPDLSVKLGTPNACNNCHTDKSAEWAAAAVENWHGPNREGFQNYADAFHAAWSDQADAATLLDAVAADANAPAFARASALTELGPVSRPANQRRAERPVGSRSYGADRRARYARKRPGRSDLAARRAASLRSDARRPHPGRRFACRGSAANQPPADRERLRARGGGVHRGAALQRRSAGSAAALGSFFAKRGRPADAEAEYKAALRLSPQYAPAAANLADLYRGLGREADGENVLRAALVASPQDAGLHHALGLALVRLKRVDLALAELRRAAELDPSQARYGYVYAVALHSTGKVDDAMTELKDNLARHPNDRDTLLALISFSRERGNAGAALEYAERLARIAPQDRGLAGLIEELQRQTGQPAAQ